MRRPSQVPAFVAPGPAQRRPQPTSAGVGTLDDWAPADGVRGSSRTQAGASRSLHALLWTLLVGAVVLGLLGLLNTGARRTVAAPAAAAAAPAANTPPGGCAELLVTAWLAGDEAVLRSLVRAEVPRLPKRQRLAGHTYTVNARSVAVPAGAATTWSYVIGADVLTVDKRGGTAPAGIQFFTVALTEDTTAAAVAASACGGWAAPTLPSQVSGLGPAAQQDLAYDRSLATTGQPIADTLAPFFTALLAGGAEVQRYLAPGVSIAAVTPAPYTKVRLERLATLKSAEVGDGQALPADGTRVQLLATVAAQAGDRPGEWRLTYPLSMSVRGGRWEITGIDAAPALPAPRNTAGARQGIGRPTTRPGNSSTPAPAYPTPSTDR